MPEMNNPALNFKAESSSLLRSSIAGEKVKGAILGDGGKVKGTILGEGGNCEGVANTEGAVNAEGAGNGGIGG